MLKRLLPKPPDGPRREFTQDGLGIAQCNEIRTGWRYHRGHFVAAALAVALVTAGAEARAGDRTTCLLPLAAGAAAAEPPPAGPLAADRWEHPGASSAAARGDSASRSWRAYLQLWHAHHADPSDRPIRRFLGLPASEAIDVRARRGRAPQPRLGWPSGGYQQVDTAHFQLLSRADRDVTEKIARDLERVYWVWTQMFFPLWDQRERVGVILSRLEPDQSVADFLKRHSFRLPVERKLRVVLFRDAARYRAALAREVPGIERSTGYYSDARRTTYLYAAEGDDAATRRHELAHQLFREATDSTLGRRIPGEAAGFWLVEGIAGYFESLDFQERTATIGGWDAPRLQYARHRVLVRGESMPLSDLRADGRQAVQRRGDLARWYAHAIAHTHWLFDGGEPAAREWVYRRLADLYAVDAELPLEAAAAPEAEAALIDQSPRRLQGFLSIDDQTLRDNPTARSLQELCLARCEVSSAGLATIEPSPHLRWLDLSGLPIRGRDVVRLAPRPESLEQLSLESTGIGASLADWLAKASGLRELDLSGTAVDDSAIGALSGAEQLETLWLTGSDVSDASVDLLIGMRGLEVVDLQQTGVTDAGLRRLERARPRLELNPLELRSR